MFFWRKKNEGFEWRDYVRTTILVRRQERKQRIHDVREAAAFGVRQAGHSGAEIVADGMSRGARYFVMALSWLSGRVKLAFFALAAATWKGLTLLTAASAEGAVRGWSLVSAVLGPVFGLAVGAAGNVMAPLLAVLERDKIRRALAVTGGIAAAAAAGRSFLVEHDTQAQFAMAIAFAAFGLWLLPPLAARDRWRPISGIRAYLANAFEWLGYLIRFAPLRGIAAGLLLAVAGAGVWYIFPLGFSLPSIETSSIARHDPSIVEGRAIALTGDRLRIGGSLVKLDGIEAPEDDQLCARPDGRTWRCGATARDTLLREVRGRRISCKLTGKTTGAAQLASCTADDKDIAEELARGGHVFATKALFSGYGPAEDEARQARRGLWFGNAQHPAEFRAQKWDEAKSAAPDGCPIKGQVSGDGRVYVLPWSPAYQRVKIRLARGERWFCSEDEALAAGWRPSERS